MPLVLGISSSQTATVVELRDADDGRIFGAGRAMHSAELGAVEQDPTLWWHALVEARHDAGGALGVSAVSAAAQQPGLVVLDEDGRVLRPALVHHDAAACDAARALEAALGAQQWVSACGSVPNPRLPITKLAWIQRNEPDTFARIAWVLQPHDWLTLRLSRHAVTDRGDASSTGYWSPRDGRWRTDLLSLVADDRDWSDCVPKVLAPNEAAGDRDGVLIAAGTGEPMAVALGLGLEPGDVVIDTAGALYSVRERPTEDATGAVAGFCDATGRFLPLVQTIDAAALIERWAAVFGLDRSRFDQVASRAPAGARGVVFVPPARSGAPGELHGLLADVESAEIARAVLEGIACALLADIDALRDANVPVGGRLFVVGRGARLHALAKVLADIAQRPVGVPNGDRAALGACVQAAAVLHGVPPEELAGVWGLRDTREVEPDPRVHGEEIRATYRALGASAV